METAKLIQDIVDLEWEMFSSTQNIGGKASCQSNEQTFRIMRKAQAMAWPEDALQSWLTDLTLAKSAGSNLIAEKYAWMMKYTSPGEFAEIVNLLPKHSPKHDALAAKLSGILTEWTEEASRLYPNICSKGRIIRRKDEIPGLTSIETYSWGEFMSYSTDTLKFLEKFYENLKSSGVNFYLTVTDNTCRMLGYESLEQAEKAAAR